MKHGNLEQTNLFDQKLLQLIGRFKFGAFQKAAMETLFYITSHRINNWMLPEAEMKKKTAGSARRIMARHVF